MSSPIISGDAKPAQIANTLNGTIRDIQAMQTTQVFKDETGTPVVILNKNGLKTTTPGSGIDVTTAENDDLTFNSNQNTLKVVLSGTVTISVTNTGFYDEFTATVAHGLSYTPAAMVFVNPPTGSGYTLQQLPYYINTYTLGTATAPTLNMQATAAVDSDSLDISIIAKTSISNFVGDWTFKYFLLQESAT